MSLTTIDAMLERASTALGQIKDLLGTTLDNKAPLDSPDFTGTPTAPTASVKTDTTQIATTAFVEGELTDRNVVDQTAGTALRLDSQQLVWWKTNSQAEIYLQFPFVAKNTDYTITFIQLNIEGIGNIPTSEISVGSKNKNGCVIDIAHSGTTGNVKGTYGLLAFIKFA